MVSDVLGASRTYEDDKQERKVVWWIAWSH